MTIERQRIGRLGEEEARGRLLESGYVIAESNWRCRSGEIDIIAEQGARLVFIEVRTRRASSSARFGTAAESVDHRKQRQVRQIAQIYMRLTGRPDAAVRFDVIAIELDREDNVRSYRHYESAF